jgi:hypothetical protein
MPGFAGDPGDRAASVPCFGQRKGAVEARERATGRSDATRPLGYYWFFSMESNPHDPQNADLQGIYDLQRKRSRSLH